MNSFKVFYYFVKIRLNLWQNAFSDNSFVPLEDKTNL
jgi:hypothetical protein